MPPVSSITALLALLLELLGSNNAIFFGGAGDGYGSATSVGVETNMIFAGGVSDGYGSATFLVGDFFFDWGDAPDPTYPTLLASNGARHALGGNLWLGATVDVDLNGQPTAPATGDDLDGVDDEDGVTWSVLVLGDPASVTVIASEPGILDAWCDFNRDGDWLDAGERIFAGQALASGANALGFSVPISASVGTTYARFRLTSVGTATPDGPAFDGEVEDYRVEIFPAVPPIADAGVDRTVATANEVDINHESVVLGGSPSASSGTPPYFYQWTFTPPAGFDLTSSTAANPVFTGRALATFTAELEVTDSNGLTDNDSVLIDVVCPAQIDLFSALLTGMQRYEATSVVTLEQTTIGSGADIEIVAGQTVVLLEGFAVETGGELSIRLDPGADCVP